MAQAIAATSTPTPMPVTTLGRLLESTLGRPVRISSIMAVTPLADYLSVVVPEDLLAGPQYQARHDDIPALLPVSLEAAEDWATDFWDPHDASQRPVRCFSCGRCLGHRYTPYWIETFVKRHPVDKVLDMLGIEPTMYCCKQTLMTYVSIPVQHVAKGKKIVFSDQ